jgi:hypothetical protein
MKRVIIVPVTETGQFPGMEIRARGGSLLRLWAIPLKREPEVPSIRTTRFSIRSAMDRQISTPSTPWTKLLDFRITKMSYELSGTRARLRSSE